MMTFETDTTDSLQTTPAKSIRRLAVVKRIDEILPIANADAIELAVVGGWRVVTRKGEYMAGSLAVYLEIDSWVPEDVAPFLSKGKTAKEYNGVAGNRLRTIRLRGEVSQGLLLPVQEFTDYCRLERQDGAHMQVEEDTDVTEFLGIQKWERADSAPKHADAKGYFPDFIPKTDQERVQNLKRDLPKWVDEQFQWEVTEKLDGSSMTVFLTLNEDNQWGFTRNFGVCSRNLELKLDADKPGTFWSVALKYDLQEKMLELGYDDIAIQGELIGPGIQGNPYKLDAFDFYVFDIYDINRKEYLLPYERIQMCSSLGLKHTPIIALGQYLPKDDTMQALIAEADGKSRLNPETVREGLVYKSMYCSDVSFKAISNEFLLGER